MLIALSLSSDLLTRNLVPHLCFLSVDGLKYSLNISLHLVHVCLPDILLIIDSLSTFKLRTQDIRWSYFSTNKSKFLACSKFLGYPSNIFD